VVYCFHSVYNIFLNLCSCEQMCILHDVCMNNGKAMFIKQLPHGSAEMYEQIVS
jgi:hypothetical protein